MRIARFCCSNANKLGSLEGEAGDHEDRDDRQESAVEGRVFNAPVRKARRAVAQNAEDHGNTGDQEDDDGHDLNGCQPELSFAINPRTERVQNGEKDKESRCPHPPRNVREPVRHDDSRGDKVS